MFKGASKFLQSGQGRDTSRPIRRYRPRTRAEQRCWWYPVINHHLSLGVPLEQKYGSKFPRWLSEEVQSFTVARWLQYWNPKTGKPLRIR